ncbi:hypothetical protein LWI29_019107 [Acer saccharum]|uniref:Uncharacterized protein n=1 Tax=Acer saccharum TaxID=4024 RepID=A0AA39VW68_ACESA|nr:hypothetical protein LWI29_019107 [Acer saccharum]
MERDRRTLISDDSLNPSLKREIDDYQGDSSETDLDQSDAISGSNDGDGVSLAGPPTKTGIGEVGVNLLKTLVVSRLATLGELNMDPPTTFEGNLYPRVEDLVKYDWIRHGFEILCGTRFLVPVTNVERAFVASTMSNTKLLSTKDALIRQMKRIEKKKGKKVTNIPALKEVKQAEKVVFIEPSSPPAKRAKKLLHPNEESSDDSLVIKFPLTYPFI